MGGLRTSCWTLILGLLLQIHLTEVQGVDLVSQKLRRLNEQFQQFQALTQARLDMLTLNQNRNSSGSLEKRVRDLSENWQRTSQDFRHLKQSTMQEIEGLREWSRKLEKKNKRIEGRLALMERNLRENRRQALKKKHDPDLDFSNFTMELQSRDERLAALQDQRDELLIGLRGLQESLKNQAVRVSRLEGQLMEVLQVNGGGPSRGSWRAGESLSSNLATQGYNEPLRRSQAHRRGRLGRVLDEHTQHRPEEIHYSQTDYPSQATGQPHQYLATPNRPKHSKAQRPHPESNPVLHIQHPNPEPQSPDYLPWPDPYLPQSQIQERPYPHRKEQLNSHQTTPSLHAQIQPQVKQQSQPRLNPPWSQNPSHQPLYGSSTSNKPATDRQTRTGLEDENRWVGGEEEESDTEVESSVIHDLLQLPVRQKIPARPAPKKDAAICNVDSMLFFPSASAENYVTFSTTLPDLPELSVCLWFRVEDRHVGTLLSYATNDNDNELVLYGRNSSVSSYHSSSYSSSPISPSSSLDFVIGDPVHRRLPAVSLLDARWHHLCVLWSSIQGHFWQYTDRHLTSSGSNFRKGWEVPGGGSVVLGQEQDTVGGGFDPAEGFAGQVAGFRVWNRVLSPAEVEGLADGRGVPRGVVLGMEDIKEVHGEVQQVACECLEHCL